MKKRILLAFSIGLSFYGFAQYADTIASGRPGQAVGLKALGAKVFQVQNGVIANYFENTNETFERYTLNNVVRVGITEHFEAVGILNYSINRFEETSSNLSNVAFGFKWRISKSRRNYLPSLSLRSDFFLPLKTDVVNRENLGNSSRLIASFPVGDNFGILSNIGLVWDGISSDPTEFYILNLKYALSSNVSVFTELYGNLSPFETLIDGGFAYILNSDLQLDLIFGTNLKDEKNWFLEIGVSWRFHWRDQD